MTISDIAKLEAECGMNDAVDTLNEVLAAYNGIMDPINDSKSACLEAAGMAEYPQATALNLLRSLMVGAAAVGHAGKDFKWDDVKDSIELTVEEPYLQLGEKFDKWKDLKENLPAWIKGYFTGALAIPDVLEKLQAIPEAITTAVGSAKDDFAALEGMELMKAVKSVKSVGSSCNTVIKELIASCQKFIDDAAELATAIPEIMKDIKDGKILEHGKKCSVKGHNGDKDTHLLDCHNEAFGKIPKGEPKKKGGCCGC